MEVSPVPSAQPRRPFRWWILAIIIVGLMGLAVCGIVGVGMLTLLGQEVEPSTITATDGQSQITLPVGWSVQKDLHDDAELQAANLRQEQYVIVLTENKADFVDTDLASYADVVLDSFLENVETEDRPTGRSVSINGAKALQYEIRGTVDNIKVVYWLTAVEGSQNYYQVLTWTLASKAEQNAPILQEVAQSFREVVK